MLAWCVAGLLTAAVGVVGRWVLRRADALGRPHSFPAASLALLVVPATVLAVPVWRHEQLQQRLGQVASRLAGQDVEVHCQTLGEQFRGEAHPDAYRSPDCTPGGRWDEHLPDAPWTP